MKFKWYHVASNLIRRLLLEDMNKIAIKDIKNMQLDFKTELI